MSGLVAVRRALLSVSDKHGLLELARTLREFDVEIISTGGTAAALAGAGISVTPIEQVTRMPEMMDGRVKTLHPAVHGGLLARRDIAAHVNAMDEHGIRPIDLVCVNLYPFVQTIRRPGVTRDEAIEQIDIGGPAMLRSAAKNHEFVAVVTDPSQYERVIGELRQHRGATSLALRQELACAAFSLTAGYDAAISGYLQEPTGDRFPPQLRLQLTRQCMLRYGENPHQAAALYRDTESREPNVVTAEVLHGKELSYNNILDAAAALEAVQDLAALAPSHRAAVIIKHTNPCGASVAPDLAIAFDHAHAGDPLAAFGGILAVSASIDDATAASICEGEKFLEVIVAPAYGPAALALLRDRWKNVRLLAVGELNRGGAASGMSIRSVAGGALVQECDSAPAAPEAWTHATGPAASPALLADAAFVWTVAKHLKSNAIAVGRGGQLLGAGCGCVDRVTACRIAIEKAGDRLARDSGGPAFIAASDAFFPFPDGPQLLIEAGVRCIVQPGGSKRDAETLDLCRRYNVTCLVTGIRHFRH